MVTLDDIDFRHINAEFIMTNSCNLKCDYCFERVRMTEDTIFERLSFEQVCGYMDLIIKNRKERKIPKNIKSRINWFGGEPMLCWDTILKVMKKYESLNIFEYSVITNGILVTEEKLDECKNIPILWQISLDSVNPEDNTYRFKNKSIEFTEYLLDLIKKINDKGFIAPIVSSVINDLSVHHMVDTYKYFADNNIPIKWQMILIRLSDQDKIIEEYNNQCLKILDLLEKREFNIPCLWENVINFYKAIKNGETIIFQPCLSESPSPNNLYLVGPNGKLYLNTNFVNVRDTDPMYYDIGGLPDGINIDKLKNHEWLKTLPIGLDGCKDCPSFAVNPCCAERKFFVYPSQFRENCNSFLSSTFYGLEYLKRKGEL